MLAHLNPDGALTDAADHARKRSVTRPVRGKDLMGRFTGRLDPITHALFLCAQGWAACDAVRNEGAQRLRDERRARMEAQPVANHRYRNHDAFGAMLTFLVDSGQLGTTQNGLPVQLIISISKADLDAAAGMARTATGWMSRLKMW